MARSVQYCTPLKQPMRSPKKCSNYRNITPAQVKPTISAELLDQNLVTIQAQISHHARSWTRKAFLQGLTERLNGSVLAKLANLLVRHDVLKTHLLANCACHLYKLGDLLLGQQVDL